MAPELKTPNADQILAVTALNSFFLFDVPKEALAKLQASDGPAYRVWTHGAGEHLVQDPKGVLDATSLKQPLTLGDLKSIAQLAA